MPYTNFKYIISGDLVGLTDVGDAKWIAHTLFIFYDEKRNDI
jgi:hypothetical protein